jgi:NhaA family Na+:H+ antiporter
MNKLKQLLASEAGSGILLVLMAIIAMILANSAVADLYFGTLKTPLTLGFGEFGLEKPLLKWINDGLMVIFFLLVGLEIKRELVQGELSSPRRAALPVIGAVGGILGPALIYVAFNFNDAETLRGWPIPTATDIAFALGVLALVRRYVAPGLRIFLLGLAIIDDLGAIILIALLFTSDLSAQALTWAALCTGVLALLNRLNVRSLLPYLIVGAALWLCVLGSGVHATLAGVVLGVMIPLEGKRGAEDSPLLTLEHALQPWVAYLVMPVFALANAGASFAGAGVGALLDPVALGIILGLFLGKQLGVFAFCWAAVRFGLANLPSGATWMSLYGVAIMTGIGFTMSLFVGSLAFVPGPHDAAIRLGVLAGSALSALVGCTWLILSRKRQ